MAELQLAQEAQGLAPRPVALAEGRAQTAEIVASKYGIPNTYADHRAMLDLHRQFADQGAGGGVEELAPIEPGALWNIEPCAASPPFQWCRFTPPWKPLPIEVPVTST